MHKISCTVGNKVYTSTNLHMVSVPGSNYNLFLKLGSSCPCNFRGRCLTACMAVNCQSVHVDKSSRA